MLKKQKSEEGEALVTTVFFNSERKQVHDRVSIDKVAYLTEADYTPSGMTALLDAVGATVEHIDMVHHYIRPEDLPPKTLFVIITDGLENASHHYSHEKVKKLIASHEEKGWEFLFLAANIDAASAAGSIGIRKERAANYSATPEGTDMLYDTVSDLVSYCRAGKSRTDDWDKKLKRKK